MDVSRFARVVLIGLLTLLATTTTAWADPIKSPQALEFNLTCGDQELTVISPSEASAVALVTDGTGAAVAARITVTTTFTDPGTGESVTTTETFIHGPGHGRARGIQDDLTTCTETFSFQDPDVGLVTGTITVTLFTTPRNTSR